GYSPVRPGYFTRHQGACHGYALWGSDRCAWPVLRRNLPTCRAYARMTFETDETAFISPSWVRSVGTPALRQPRPHTASCARALRRLATGCPCTHSDQVFGPALR